MFSPVPEDFNLTNENSRKGVFQEAKDFLERVIDSESSNRTRAIEALNFRDGVQWDNVLLQSRKDRLNITVNHTDTMVTRVENSIKQQRPRIKCHPLNDADVDKAQLVNGIVRDIENKSQATVAYDAGASMALTIGWGYWRIVAEYANEFSFDQELRIKPIRNPFQVYKDPMSVLPDGSDAKQYLISTKMKRKEYKARHPKASNAEFVDLGVGDGMTEWDSREEIRLAEYYRIAEKSDRLFKMEDGSTMFESDFEPGEIAKLRKMGPAQWQEMGFAVEGEQLVERKSYRHQVEWFKINGTEVVDYRELPGKYIPIVLVTGNVLDLNGKVRYKGMVENLIQPAKLVNYWESSKAERLALTSKAPWVAYEGVIEGHPEWQSANQTNQSVLVAKAVAGPNGEILPLPQRVEAVPVEAGFAEASQDAERQLMAIAGMPHEPGQDSEGEVVSGVALKQRRALSDDTHYQYYDNTTMSIAFTGRILFDQIPYYYSTERQQRIIGEDGVPKVVWINQTIQDEQGSRVHNDMSIGQYDVVMDTGPGYDTKRQEGSEALTQLMGTPMGEIVAKAAPDVVMRSYDFPYAEEIADRLLPQSPEGMKKALEQLPKQAQTIVQSMQQELSAAQQKIQQLEADLKYGLTKTLHQDATKLQIENLRDARAEKDTATDTFTKLEDTHTRAHTSIAVAEINAGAKLIDSNQDRSHEKDLAKMTAESAEKAEKAKLN